MVWGFVRGNACYAACVCVCFFWSAFRVQGVVGVGLLVMVAALVYGMGSRSRE